MEELVNAIGQEDLPSPQQTEIYTTLAKVLGNIVRNPAETKYRSLKKDNRMVQERIVRSTAAVSLLLALGFEDDGAAYTCPTNTGLEHMEEVVELLQCVVASREDVSAPITATAATSPATASQPAAGAAERHAPMPTAATAKAALNPHSFARRDDTEKMRSDQASQLAAVRAAQQAQYSDGGSTPSTSADTDGSEAKKKPAKSAFDFESRSKKQEEAKKAAGGLEDLRQMQREKFKDFKSDPAAQQSEAYQRPASVASGGQAQQGWGDWLSGWFGSGSSGSGGSNGRQDRRGPNVKGIGDLPKPVRRG